MGYIDSRTSPQRYVTADDVGFGMGYDLAPICKLLGESRQRWSAEDWRDNIKVPVEAHFQEWMQGLNGIEAEAGAKAQGEATPVDEWTRANWDESFFVELDARLQSLLFDLESDRLWLEKQRAAEVICDGVTETSVGAGARNKVLDARWRSLWRLPGCDGPRRLPAAYLNGEQGANRLAQVFRELMRFVMDGTTDVIRESNGSDLRRALRDYLSLRRLAVQPSAAAKRDADPDEPAAESASGRQRKRRGRKKADFATEQREAKLADEWDDARENRVYKSDFVHDNHRRLLKFGIKSVPDFDRLLDRVGKRQKHSE
jgi:hypothetical protein